MTHTHLFYTYYNDYSVIAQNERAIFFKQHKLCDYFSRHAFTTLVGK